MRLEKRTDVDLCLFGLFVNNAKQSRDSQSDAVAAHWPESHVRLNRHVLYASFPTCMHAK